MIEHATGKPVLFIAYPFGDYDHYLVDSVGRAGYGAALTCEAGKVRRGSNPLRMRRMVVDKKWISSASAITSAPARCRWTR